MVMNIDSDVLGCDAK